MYGKDPRFKMVSQPYGGTIPNKSHSVCIQYGIMIEELIIHEIRINEATFRYTNDEFRGHYAT